MLTFLGIFGLSLGALLIVQQADIECVNPPKRRVASVRASNAMALKTVTRAR